MFSGIQTTLILKWLYEDKAPCRQLQLLLTPDLSNGQVAWRVKLRQMGPSPKVHKLAKANMPQTEKPMVLEGERFFRSNRTVSLLKNQMLPCSKLWHLHFGGRSQCWSLVSVWAGLQQTLALRLWSSSMNAAYFTLCPSLWIWCVHWGRLLLGS